MALLAGSVPCPLEVEADRAAEAGWRFSQVPDVYAAAARLLRTDRPRPDAVLVLVESLRGDELRFFDLLARRWPDLPAAAVYCLCAEDRRLEACRLRNVAVLSASGFTDWLIAQQPVSHNTAPSSASGVDPTGPLADCPPAADVPGGSSGAMGATGGLSASAPDATKDSSGAMAASSAAMPSATPAASAAPGASAVSGATGSLSASASAQASEPPTSDPAPPDSLDVDLDLPDEWADLPDPDDSEAEPAAEREYDADDLPDESDDREDQELRDEGKDDFSYEGVMEDHDPEDAQDLPERVPLTPWSDVPRPQRRRPDRIPPQNGGSDPSPAEPAQSPAPSGSETGPSSPATRNPPAAARQSGWEHGLLTPEELRALLQESDDTAGPQEAQP
jgi:hypothetical protein